MEITQEILNSEKEAIRKILLTSYGKDSKEYRDMMFALNTYHYTLKFILGK